jgi:ring-1,2-phenylacetyl-CoA epoxidase subunit PaaD
MVADNGTSHANVDDARGEGVWAALSTVMDPEIPDLSIVELGMVAGVTVAEGATTVRITPTFAACPALAHIQAAAKDAVKNAGFDGVEVRMVFDPPWTSDRITPTGLEKLKLFGLAPPPRMNGKEIEPRDLERVACPFCDSKQTVLESTFGPTLCRSIHYCNTCQQSFEHFKPVT